MFSLPTARDWEVSIPRSGFCWFGQRWRYHCSRCYAVSIPRSGFCWFGPDYEAIIPSKISTFQSLGRDSVGLDPQRRRATRLSKTCFNPSVGILLVWTEVDFLDSAFAALVSIPRSGFCWFGHYCGDVYSDVVARFNPSVGILLVWTWQWLRCS